MSRSRYENEYEEDYDDRPRRRGGFRCPYCGARGAPILKKKVSTVGWVILLILLFTTVILFWIGLFFKEEYRECSECGLKVGG